VWAILFLGLGMSIYVFLRSNIESKLQIPVFCYAFIIGSMGWRAAARIGSRFSTSWSTVGATLGALIFIASDSIIAINKFHSPIPDAKLFIMITYYLGQYLIAGSVVGAMSVSKGKKE
jgi:alkenylglycerophosphocholine hydrolase